MGNKKKNFMFGTLLLLGLLFAGSAAKAEDCYDICANDSNPDACFADCQGTYGNGDFNGGGVGDFSDINMDGAPDGNTQGVYTYADCKGDGGGEIYCGQFPGAPVESQNLNYMSDGTCKKDADCGAGFECYQGTCIDKQSYSDNTAWYDRAWEGTTDFFTGDRNTPLSAGLPSFKINAATSIPGIGNVPKGSTISSTGVVTSPDGRELGYVSSSALSDLEQAAGGILTALDYSNGGGYYGSSYNGGLSGSLAQGSKCGAGFVPVGGVCFPDKSITGLSDMPISNIIANLFVWLMGIFVTLAVIAFVLSGVMYFLSSADADMAKKAKENAKNALIGIIIGLSGFIIVQAIAKALAGASIF